MELKPCWNKQNFLIQFIFKCYTGYCKAHPISITHLFLTHTLQDSLDKWSTQCKTCA